MSVESALSERGGGRCIAAIARLTRRWHPRGTDRLLRMLYNPDRRRVDPASAVIQYDGALRILARTQSFVGWRVFFFGDFEPHTGAVIRANLSPGDQAIDVGANIGCHALRMADAVGDGGKVVAFEPNPGAHRQLRANVARNGLGNLTPVGAAVADRPGRMTLHMFADEAVETGTSSLHADNVRRYVGDRGELTAQDVPVITLDGYAAEAGLHQVRLVKIDTEGFEVAVLLGAQDLLSAQRPLVIFEYGAGSWQAAGYSWDDATRIFDGLGYRISLITASGVRALPSGPAPDGEYLARPAT